MPFYSVIFRSLWLLAVELVDSLQTHSAMSGYYIGPRQIKHKIAPATKFLIAYEVYFVMPMGDQDKSWAPHFCCKSCRSTLEDCLLGSQKCMSFAILQIWREETNHHDDLFLYCRLSTYKKGKYQKNVVYLNIPSSSIVLMCHTVKIYQYPTHLP